MGVVPLKGHHAQMELNKLFKMAQDTVRTASVLKTDAKETLEKIDDKTDKRWEFGMHAKEFIAEHVQKIESAWGPWEERLNGSKIFKEFKEKVRQDDAHLTVKLKECIGIFEPVNAALKSKLDELKRIEKAIPDPKKNAQPKKPPAKKAKTMPAAKPAIE